MARDPRDHPLLAPGTRPLLGVVHLPPLAGPHAMDPEALLEAATADAESYLAAGFDALILENHGDPPYPKDTSDPHVSALMALIADHVRTTTKLPVGINILRNDAKTALAVATAAQCDLIRVNVLTGAVVADQGIIEGCARELHVYRQSLGPHADKVLIAADVHVKHARPMAERPIEEEARDAVTRAGADILLVTGPSTGDPADLEEVRRVQEAVPGVPVWVASGVTEDTAVAVMETAHGAIVGTAAKKEGRTSNPVDPQHARTIAAAAGKTPH